MKIIYACAAAAMIGLSAGAGDVPATKKATTAPTWPRPDETTVFFNVRDSTVKKYIAEDVQNFTRDLAEIEARYEKDKANLRQRLREKVIAAHQLAKTTGEGNEEAELSFLANALAPRPKPVVRNGTSSPEKLKPVPKQESPPDH